VSESAKTNNISQWHFFENIV